MPSFRTGVVARLLMERPGFQRVDVDLAADDTLAAETSRAFVLSDLVGTVDVGDHVIVNTTAVELGLGTGGFHVVHWNLSHNGFRSPGPGHIVKLRYTSLQSDVGSFEEHHPELADVMTIGGMPVVVAGLHSQIAGVAVGFAQSAPGKRLAYVMSDGGSLPLVFSDLVATLLDKELIHSTITAGHAFGGEIEAVTIYSALVAARELARADAVVVAMGPGIVGTGSRLGTSGLEVATVLDAVATLGGDPIACLRASFGDPRPRHQGLSHHSATALGVACRSRVSVAVPVTGGTEEHQLRSAIQASGIADRHDLVDIEAPDVCGLFDRHELHVSSMGRSAAEDPILFSAAAAAGILAGARIVT